MDVLTPPQRHNNMSHIRGRDTSPEKTIRSALHRAGFRFRICDRRYPGKPDIVLPRHFTVIFINGCFWHAHEGCRYFRMPSSNVDFWKAKFERNRERDAEVIQHYKDECWRICIIWECALRGKNKQNRIDSVAAEVCTWLDEGSEPFLEIKA